MSTDLYPEESNKIIGLAMQAHTELGCGFREKTYENALAVLLKKSSIEYSQQTRFPIIFHGEKIDEFIPDLIVFGKIIVDIKTIDQITNIEIGQMLNYLKVTGLKLAIIINCKNKKLEVRRVIRSSNT